MCNLQNFKKYRNTDRNEPNMKCHRMCLNQIKAIFKLHAIFYTHYCFKRDSMGKTLNAGLLQVVHGGTKKEDEINGN